MPLYRLMLGCLLLQLAAISPAAVTAPPAGTDPTGASTATSPPAGTDPTGASTATSPPAGADPTGQPATSTSTSAPAATQPPATESDGKFSEEPYDSGEYPSPGPTPNRGANLLLEPSASTVPSRPKQDDESHEAGEVMIISQNMQAARALAGKLANSGYGIKRRRLLKNLGFVINVVRLPAGKQVPAALKELRKLAPRQLADANHRYQLSGGRSGQQAGQGMIGWGKTGKACGKGLSLGLLDTGVDTRHDSIPASRVTARSFLPIGVEAAEPRHGTAIASILIGRPGSSVSGLLPAARLYNASVFRKLDKDRIDTTAELIIAGLDWLQGHKVHVVNMSLAGRRNQLLEMALQHLLRNGLSIAAAAGNQGKNAPPAFPASVPGVMAVTAVDNKQRIYRHANHGGYIDLAAPGVDIWAARPGRKGAYYSGTSFAVPFVSAALARLKQANHGRQGKELYDALFQKARDLGSRGRDPVYGHGLLQYRGACS